MCGRFVSASPPGEIARYFDAEAPEAALEPSYNVAPTNDVYVVLADGRTRRVTPMHWGLVPRWAKDPSVGNRMINARAETLASKGAFKPAFQKRRCLVPADGFYEWKAVPGQKRKQPVYIHRPDGEPLAFAGLWEVWRDPGASDAEREAGGGSLRSCTIITGEPNETVRPVHDRMPVILPRSQWDTWLDPDVHDLEVLGRLLVPAPPSLVALRPVSTEVNNVRNKGAHLVDEVDPVPEGELPGQSSLL
ncbi:SOS response-associated peptidase [Rhabdothermincola salaria]|uniref:SOS response-associated peptidase n=1 Tax=Rhabdothermincola salaria TaxID=2903142 RepID=UPI001E55295A|nr:SOS response-associated peptidase [Rhabdothermincola salaria]MCD9623108.1 SOS response-associated peptidase [Rhabdothermincola salaria]